MIAWLDLAARGEAEVVTSPMTLVEAYYGRTTEQRWGWVLSRLKVADIGKDEARQARRLLSDAKLHGHKYAIDAVLAIIARRQKGQVTVFTSDVDDLDLFSSWPATTEVPAVSRSARTAHPACRSRPPSGP